MSQVEDGSLEDVLAAVGDPSRLRRVGYNAQRAYLCGIAAAVERAIARREDESPLERMRRLMEQVWLAALDVPPSEYGEGDAFAVYKIGQVLGGQRCDELVASKLGEAQ